MKRPILLLMAAALAAAPLLDAQAEATIFKKKKKKKVENTAPQTQQPRPAAPASRGGLQPYASVITAKAKTMNGFFKVHNVDGKYYFEIPDTLFGRDVLIVNRIAKAPVSAQKRKTGYPGDYLSDQVVQFEKGEGNRLFVREMSFLEHSTDTLGMYQAVKNANIQPIVAVFDLKAVNKKGGVTSYVVDMTDYIRQDNEMFSFSSSAKEKGGVATMIPNASYIDTLKAFPKNIEVRTVRTYQPRRSAASSSPLAQMMMGASSSSPLTYELNSSMMLLPKEPMKPRLFDPRVGYFAVNYTDFDRNPQGIERNAKITRWRLEPKAEDVEKYLKGELVEPKQPIVIYIDPATPKKWVPYLIQGVNDWQAAFEQAGFKNAIIAKEAPKDDPTWSIDDVSHSAIVYKPSDIPNASGPHVHDPRSGEILETHINWYHNVMQLLHDWYQVQAGAIDPEARKPIFSDELMGQLIRFVSSHEVGHTLGLRHNFGSSHTVPVEKLRDKAWVEANGHTPSIMDYARFNYVAQPEDNISHSGIFPRIGMYDKWAIEWGYRWFPQFATANDEVPYLNKWIISKLKEDKRYTFGTESDANDPRNQNEDLGDDAMLASSYGIKNLKRLMPEILKWNYEPNADYEKATNFYKAITNQFGLYMGHVAKNVAGIYSTPVTVEQKDTKAMEYVPKAIQQKAVDFLNKELFTTPTWLIRKDLNETLGVVSNGAVANLQANIVTRLINANAFNKMTYDEMQNGSKAYTADNLFNDLKKTVWKSLYSGGQPDIYQRGMQKAYVNGLISMIDKTKAAKAAPLSDAAAIARGQLTELKRRLSAAANGASGITRSHYLNLAAMIDAAFEAK